MNDNLNMIINQYEFVRTTLERNSKEFIQKRIVENNIVRRQRDAISFCKKINGINTLNISKITNDDKTSIEECLRQNYLEKDPNYFGERKYIYLDLFD